jgi:phosphatidylinositol alpha-1,6-mannosyltransferase
MRSVTFLTYHYPPEIGGIQTRISHYVEELLAMGIRVTVIFVTSDAKALSYSRKGKFILVKCPGGEGNLGTNTSLLATELIRSSPDVIHVFTGASTLLGMLALICGRLFRKPSAMSVFGREDVTLPSRTSRTIFLTSASLATSISTNSEATRDILPVRFRKKSHVLLGGSDWMPAGAPATVGDSSILFVGRLVGRKGVDDLLNAFAEVKSRVTEAKLVIVGDGPERENLERMVAEHGLSGAVRFTGTLRGELLHEEYEKCDVFVLPSKAVKDDTASEGLGLTLIEAAMHGKPLVGTTHGGIPEVIQDGINGLLVPPDNPHLLAEALTRLVKDKELARKMGENSFKSAQSLYSWKAATDRLLQSYGGAREGWRP